MKERRDPILGDIEKKKVQTNESYFFPLTKISSFVALKKRRVEESFLFLFQKYDYLFSFLVLLLLFAAGVNLFAFVLVLRRTSSAASLLQTLVRRRRGLLQKCGSSVPAEIFAHMSEGSVTNLASNPPAPITIVHLRSQLAVDSVRLA